MEYFVVLFFDLFMILFLFFMIKFLNVGVVKDFLNVKESEFGVIILRGLLMFFMLEILEGKDILVIFLDFLMMVMSDRSCNNF